MYVYKCVDCWSETRKKMYVFTIKVDTSSLCGTTYLICLPDITVTSHEHHGVSNHRQFLCFSSRFRRTSKKTSKLLVNGLCEGNHRWPMVSPHKGLVTRKMFSINDVIMSFELTFYSSHKMAMFRTSSISSSYWPLYTYIRISPPSPILSNLRTKTYEPSVIIWQLAELLQSGGREFDPRRVHENLSVPLWVYMRFPVPEHQK